MSVKIRLARGGAKKKPFYQIVVADERCPRDGRYIENIGQYNPLCEPVMLSLKADRALAWLNKGAQPSEMVLQLLRKDGVWAKFKETKQA
jgi:small subunit ribosomal protein S16